MPGIDPHDVQHLFWPRGDTGTLARRRAELRLR
jgi:hypothetical protein